MVIFEQIYNTVNSNVYKIIRLNNPPQCILFPLEKGSNIFTSSFFTPVSVIFSFYDVHLADVLAFQIVLFQHNIVLYHFFTARLITKYSIIKNGIIIPTATLYCMNIIFLLSIGENYRIFTHVIL